jgi:hypothetical protein
MDIIISWSINYSTPIQNKSIIERSGKMILLIRNGIFIALASILYVGCYSSSTVMIPPSSDKLDEVRLYIEGRLDVTHVDGNPVKWTSNERILTISADTHELIVNFDGELHSGTNTESISMGNTTYTKDSWREKYISQTDTLRFDFRENDAYKFYCYSPNFKEGRVKYKIEPISLFWEEHHNAVAIGFIGGAFALLFHFIGVF